MRVKLGDIFEIGSGGTPSKSHPEYYGGNIPWVKTGDLKNEYLYEVEDFITEEGLNNSSAKMYEEDTVLIAMYGATIGATSILKMKACTNQACAAFRKNEQVIPEYLYYFLRSQKEKFVKDGVGGAQPNISAGYLKKVEMELPSLDEQKVIVDILDKISDVVCKRSFELQSLDDLIKARFVELFSSGEFPQVTISELVSGKVQSVKKVFSPDDEIKYIDISSIDNKRNVMTGYTEYILSEAPSRAQQHIKKGDIVISTVRPNLRNVAMTEFEDDNLVASSGFCVLRASKCLPEYLLAIVCSDKFTDDMTKVVTGANYPAIKDSDIMGYYVSKPPMELQVQFTDFVKQVDKSKVAIQKALNQAQTLFDSLMQDYFG